MEAIHRIVDGKSIALVGNASSLLKQGKADEIDSHDVVIRINAGIPPLISPKRIGKKFTIWATARHFINEVPNLPKVDAVLWMKLTSLGNHELERMCCKRRDLPDDIVRWPLHLAHECIQYCQCDPGVGLRLLWWLKIKATPARVSVYGMDSWASPTSWSGAKRPTPNHNPEREALMVQQLCAL